jgi:hypothetical protein
MNGFVMKKAKKEEPEHDMGGVARHTTSGLESTEEFSLRIISLSSSFFLSFNSIRKKKQKKNKQTKK